MGSTPPNREEQEREPKEGCRALNRQDLRRALLPFPAACAHTLSNVHKYNWRPIPSTMEHNLNPLLLHPERREPFSSNLKSLLDVHLFTSSTLLQRHVFPGDHRQELNCCFITAYHGLLFASQNMNEACCFPHELPQKFYEGRVANQIYVHHCYLQGRLWWEFTT